MLRICGENGKIAPDLDKVKAIENFPVCTSKKSVLAFLGVTGYYHRHVENCSQRAFPLAELSNTISLINFNERC